MPLSFLEGSLNSFAELEPLPSSINDTNINCDIAPIKQSVLTLANTAQSVDQTCKVCTDEFNFFKYLQHTDSTPTFAYSNNSVLLQKQFICR